MRIAVSGTHGSGKSTLIDAWLGRHSHYLHEPEPYVVLQELHGERFADQPDIADFERQLEFQADVLARYSAASDVIFERSPADFLAYMLVIDERTPRRQRGEVDRWLSAVGDSIRFLDAIVFVPLDDTLPIDVPEDEDPELREAVNDRLHDILIADEFGLIGDAPLVIEVGGGLQKRLETVERMLRAHPLHGS